MNVIKNRAMVIFFTDFIFVFQSALQQHMDTGLRLSCLSFNC